MIHRQVLGVPSRKADTPRRRSWRVGTGTLSVLVLLFVGGSLFHATTTLGGAFPAANGKLAYTSYQGGNTDVYTSNSDGSGETRLTTDSNIDTHPAISADGSQIVYATKQGGGAFEIYSMSTDGSGKTNLSNHANSDFDPTWSPDGTKVAFTSDRSGNIDIWVIDADGTDAVNLTSGVAEEDQEPTWSPDGTKIAFTSKRSGNFDVWVMNADGSNPVNLTGSVSGEDQWPTWSPDGTKIAFTSKRSGNHDVWAMNADGSTPVNLTSDSGTEDQEPTWSPDGTKIAFASKRSGNFDVWAMNADGSAPANYTSDNSQEDQTPDWGGLPGAPTFSGTNPASPANDNDPEVLGIAPAGTTVRLYTDAACSSTVAASGSAAQFSSPGLTVSVADDSTTTFYATATNAGGTSPCSLSSVTFSEDSTAPLTSITVAPTSPTGDSTPSFSFESSEPGSSFECRIDSGAWVACTSPHTVDPLLDGSHTFEVRAVDAAGNTDQTPASATFTVDTVAPETTITEEPLHPTGDSTPSFSFESSEPGSSFECRIDAGAWAACSSPHTVDPLADGSHTFEVRAVDAAGNTDQTPASVTFTVDTVAPETSITGGPSGPTGDSTPGFSFESSEPGSSFECRVDGGAWVACSSPHTVGPLADGSHTVEVRAVDAAGNTDQTPASVTFTVDTVVPSPAEPGGAQPGGSQPGGSPQRRLAPGLEDLSTIPGNLAAAERCQRLGRPVRSRSLHVPSVGTVRVGLRASAFVTPTQPARVTVRGPRALGAVRYLLNGRILRGAARAPFKLALKPAALSSTTRNVLTIRLSPRRGKAKRVKLRMNTTPCRTVFVAAQRRTGDGSRLRLRVDSVRALRGITFKLPSSLLPKRIADQPVGKLTVRTAGGGRKSFRLSLHEQRGRWVLRTAGAARVVMRRGRIDITRLPDRTGIVGLELNNGLPMMRSGRQVKLRARVVSAEGVETLSVALRGRSRR